MSSIQKLKGQCRSLLANIYYNLIPYQDIILFESLPNFSDNSKAVFDEMLRRGMNRKYTLIWGVDGDPAQFPKIDNVVYYNLKDEEQSRRYYKARLRARCLISCNIFLPSVKASQPSFYLSHGTTIKKLRGIFMPPKNITYFLAASPCVEELQAYEFDTPRKKFFSLGFPRNDALTAPRQNTKKFFEGDFEKIVVWYPTYRQHKIGFCTASQNALPIIHNEHHAMLLNEAARESKVLLVIKPHFVQDVSYVKDLGLSNIRFIDDSFFAINAISAYHFVGSCDALITDYSSIYYDYTLCDKPIAAIWEDIEAYKKKPGLVDNYEYYMSGAEKVYTTQDLIGFIQRVGSNIDVLADERRKIRDVVNYAADGKNASRVVDFIVDKARLK